MTVYNQPSLSSFSCLVFSNGEEWYRLRSAVQQNLMRPKAIEVYLPIVTEIADEFIERVKEIMDDSGHVPDLRNEISKWNIECKFNTENV